MANSIGWLSCGRVPRSASAADPTLGTQRATDRADATARLQVPFPAVHLTGQHVALDLAEPGQVGLQVRAPTLEGPSVHGDRLVIVRRLGEPALGVVQPLLGQALEERVDVLVVRTDP